MSMNLSRYAIEVWHLEEATLSDGSKVFEVEGACDEAKVTFNCVDRPSAEALQAMLMSASHVSSASAEAL